MICTLSVLTVIICVRKRYILQDWFFVMGPLAFCISSVFGIILDIWILDHIKDGAQVDLRQILPIAAFHEMFCLLGNWFFIS